MRSRACIDNGAGDDSITSTDSPGRPGRSRTRRRPAHLSFGAGIQRAQTVRVADQARRRAAPADRDLDGLLVEPPAKLPSGPQVRQSVRRRALLIAEQEDVPDRPELCPLRGGDTVAGAQQPVGVEVAYLQPPGGIDQNPVARRGRIGFVHEGPTALGQGRRPAHPTGAGIDTGNGGRRRLVVVQQHRPGPGDRPHGTRVPPPDRAVRPGESDGLDGCADRLRLTVPLLPLRYEHIGGGGDVQRVPLGVERRRHAPQTVPPGSRRAVRNAPDCPGGSTPSRRWPLTPPEAATTMPSGPTPDGRTACGTPTVTGCSPPTNGSRSTSRRARRGPRPGMSRCRRLRGRDRLAGPAEFDRHRSRPAFLAGPLQAFVTVNLLCPSPEQNLAAAPRLPDRSPRRARPLRRDVP